MKPILFNTEMVKAILKGSKTQTRRVIKPQPSSGVRESVFVKSGLEDGHGRKIKLKYQIGEILYVRETWSLDESLPYDNYVYRTNYGTAESDSFPPSMFKWRPSIHMPKEAARIFLKVTGLRVERLQDITENEVFSEGLEWFDDRCVDENWRPIFYDPDSGGGPQMLKGFKILWNSTINKTDLHRYGWDANPWVWVIDFEVIKMAREVE